MLSVSPNQKTHHHGQANSLEGVEQKTLVAEPPQTRGTRREPGSLLCTCSFPLQICPNVFWALELAGRRRTHTGRGHSWQERVGALEPWELPAGSC